MRKKLYHTHVAKLFIYFSGKTRLRKTRNVDAEKHRAYSTPIRAGPASYDKSYRVLAELLPEYTIRALFPGNTPHHLDTVCRKNVDKREPH